MDTDIPICVKFDSQVHNMRLKDGACDDVTRTAKNSCTECMMSHLLVLLRSRNFGLITEQYSYNIQNIIFIRMCV